jgi:hypothetical protein
VGSQSRLALSVVTARYDGVRNGSKETRCTAGNVRDGRMLAAFRQDGRVRNGKWQGYVYERGCDIGEQLRYGSR